MVGGETDSNCETCLVGDKSVKLVGINSYSVSLDLINHGHTCLPFCLEMILVTEIKFKILHLKI